jgi:serine/threonine protein kinase
MATCLCVAGNLLVNESLCVKVADFGLSKVIKEFQTMTGGLGTYQWMAPEVLQHSQYSQKADVYSFGIVLWECAARQVPYAGTLGVPAALAVLNQCVSASKCCLLQVLHFMDCAGAACKDALQQ